MSSFLQGTFVQAAVLITSGSTQHSEWAQTALKNYYGEQKRLKLVAGTRESSVIGNRDEVVYVTPETIAGTLLSGKIDPDRFLGVTNIDEVEENVPKHYTIFSVQGHVDESGVLKKFFLPVAVEVFTKVLAKGTEGRVARAYNKPGNLKPEWVLDNF